MKVSPRISIAIKSPYSRNTLSCEFELREGYEKQDRFFECTGCRGAGLGCFPADRVYIPDGIMEEMEIHAQLCEAIIEQLHHKKCPG